MTSIEVLAALGGAAMAAAGLALLALAWSQKRRSRGAAIVGGWIFIALSAWPWAIFGGADRGPAIAACVLMLAALSVVMRNGATAGRVRAQAAEEPEPIAAASSPDRIPWIRRTWIFLLAGPVAFVSATALGLAAFAMSRGADADGLALAAYLVPIVWSMLAVWAVADPKLARKSMGVVGSGAAGGLALIFLTTN